MIVSAYPIGFFQTDLQFCIVSHISQLQEFLQCPDFCISSVQCGIVVVAPWRKYFWPCQTCTHPGLWQMLQLVFSRSDDTALFQLLDVTWILLILVWPFWVWIPESFQPKLLIVFYVLLVCKCVLYCCHWVSTQLQLTNISISISWSNTVILLFFAQPSNSGAWSGMSWCHASSGEQQQSRNCGSGLVDWHICPHLAFAWAWRGEQGISGWR